jgi:thioredoxin reductase
MICTGVTPAYFRWAARQQLFHYTTVTMINGTVIKITPADAQNTHFTVTSRDPAGRTDTNLTARKIVLATGLRDILPSTPGIRENWGQGIFWCPWCDGHEHADQPLGLLGSLDNVPAAVREMLTLNRDIVALVNGTDTPEFRALTDSKLKDWRKYLEIHNVKVDNRTITRITRLRQGTDGNEDPSLPTVAEHDLFRVEFTEGDPVDRAAFLAAFPSEQTSKVGEEMGVQLWGGRLAVDPTAGLVTNVPGVYAVGDANSDNTTNVPHALFSGKRTAVYLHGESSLCSALFSCPTSCSLPCFRIASFTRGHWILATWLLFSVHLQITNNRTVRLAREDGDEELRGAETTKRDLEHAARSLWDVVNGGPEDILHAGEFDQ